MAAVNFHAVAALIVFCYEIPGEEGLHGLFGLKQLILNGEEQVVVQNLQKGTNFGCQERDLGGLVFSGSPRIPCRVSCHFESKLDVTCVKAGLSLVVWLYLVACCRAFTAHLREKGNYLHRTATTCEKYQTCFIYATFVACVGNCAAVLLTRCNQRSDLM